MELANIKVKKVAKYYERVVFNLKWGLIKINLIVICIAHKASWNDQHVRYNVSMVNEQEKSLGKSFKKWLLKLAAIVH